MEGDQFPDYVTVTSVSTFLIFNEPPEQCSVGVWVERLDPSDAKSHLSLKKLQ